MPVAIAYAEHLQRLWDVSKGGGAVGNKNGKERGGQHPKATTIFDIKNLEASRRAKRIEGFSKRFDVEVGVVSAVLSKGEVVSTLGVSLLINLEHRKWHAI